MGCQLGLHFDFTVNYYIKLGIVSIFPKEFLLTLGLLIKDRIIFLKAICIYLHIYSFIRILGNEVKFWQ